MPSLPFCRPDRIRAATWTLAVGTAVGSDYAAAMLVDNDPSSHVWIEETSIGLGGDLGAAVRVDGVAVIHHNFAAGTDVRLRVGSSPGGADFTVDVTVGAWLGRFAPHLYFNAAAAAPVEANRTRRYLYVENLDANTAPVKIGELVVCGQVDTLTRGIRVGLRPPTIYGRAIAEGKKGAQFIHDRMTRDRSWLGSLGQDATDLAAYKAWQDQSYGVRPFVVWPLNSIAGEPVFARFTSAVYDPTLITPRLATVPIEIRELACGEAYV